MPKRWKEEDNKVILRNDADTVNAHLAVGAFSLLGYASPEGQILTSDTEGEGTWQVNPAIEAAQTALDSANAAEGQANQALADAAVAQGAADAAAVIADGAAAAAGAAAAEATAAAAAAAAAEATAAAAAAGAATAFTAAVVAGTSADNAQTTADRAFHWSFSIFGDELSYDTGTGIRGVNPSVPYNWFTASADSNAYAWAYINMNKGIWRLSYLTILGSVCGIVNIYIGSVLVATQDLYEPADSFDKTFMYPDIEIANSGVHTVIFETIGKNIDSSGYIVAINKFWGYKTDA